VAQLKRYLDSLSLRAAVLIGAVGSLATIWPVFLIGGNIGLAIDTAQQVCLGAIGVLVLIRASRQSRVVLPERRFVAKWIAVAIALGASSVFVWVLPFARDMWAIVGDALVVASVGTAAACLGHAIFKSTPRSVWLRVGLDTTILLTASVTIIWIFWHSVAPTASLTAGDLSNAVAGTIAVAGPIAAALSLLDRGVPVRLSGPFGILAGLCLAGLSMVGFQLASQSQSGSAFLPTVTPTDYAFSAGLLLCAYGAATWQALPSAAAQKRHAAQMLADALPPVAAAVCVALLILWPTNSSDSEALKVGAAVVAVLTLGRQMLLTRTERLAMTAERRSMTKLERELRSREAVLRSLSRLEIAETAEETAAHVCREALAIDGIDSAILVAFMPGRQAVLLGATHMREIPRGITGVFPPERARQLCERAAAGPWIEGKRPDTAPEQGGIFGPDVACVVNAPLLWKDGTLGVISLGSSGHPSESVAVERLSTAREFGVVAGALLGPMLGERARLEEIQARVSAMIGACEFQPVFQPIVELASGRTVGYEALTRFSDGRRPDHWFADAAMAGIGVQLEIATMAAAQDAAAFLPADAYLSLNVSPALATAFLPLVATLETSTRDTVLEITEQVPVESYANLRIVLDHLRGQVRIAVDDAGAGYAGLRHILEIRPQIVKLDIALVRGVDADPARRALISSMVAFATETNCALVAEGVETEAELATLRGLGVTHGQGYLFGRPAPIEQLLRQEGSEAALIAQRAASGDERAVA
jgi:EAL domain-containing protein (putative c-di-GMP-specific phosphodiesterase class I)